MTDRQNDILAGVLIVASAIAILWAGWSQYKWERAQRYYR